MCPIAPSIGVGCDSSRSGGANATVGIPKAGGLNSNGVNGNSGLWLRYVDDKAGSTVVEVA